MKSNNQTPENQLKDIEFENRMLSKAINNYGQWVMLETPAGKISCIVGAFENITGYHPDEIDSSAVFKSLIKKTDDPDFDGRFGKAALRQNRYQMQFTISTRHGETRQIDHQAVKYFDDNGDFAGWLSTNRDITQSKIALLNMVYENMNEGVMVGEIICNEKGVPKDWRFLMMNQAHEEHTGLSNDHIIGKRVLDVFPDIEKTWISKYGKVALTGIPEKFEDYNHNTGRHYHISCFQIVPGQFAVVLADVTKQKNIELRLRKSEQLYHFIVNTQKELICRHKPDTTLVFVNSAYCKTFNTPEEKLLGHKFLQFIPVTDHDAVFDQIRELLAVGGEHKIVHQVILPGNKMAWYEWTNYAIPSETDDVEILSVGYDITDQYNAEKQLLETIRRFNTISDFSKTVYWEVDEKGLYNYVSEGCRNIYGYSSDELVGKMHFYDLHPGDEREDIIKRAFRVFKGEGKFDDFQGKLLTKEGEIRWFSTSGLPVYDQHGVFRGYRGSDMDITLRKKQQEIINNNMKQIHDYQAKLQRLNLVLAESEEHVKKDIAQFLHDEIGQLLSAMHIQLSFLDVVDDEVQVKQTFESVKNQLNKAIIQCREMTYELSPPVLKKYGINEAIKWKLNEVQNNHGITTSFHSEIEKLNVNSKIKLMIFRIVAELINNAVKHANATTLKAGIKSENKEIRFTVEDDGQGFDYDYQKDLSSKNSFGLFNIRERVSFLGGKFTIRSGKKGTTATIVLPEM